MKNITLSAPEALIAQARKQAAAQGTSLNEQFRLWLQSQTTTGEQQAAQYRHLVKQLSHANAGRTFSRQEMNER